MTASYSFVAAYLQDLEKFMKILRRIMFFITRRKIKAEHLNIVFPSGQMRNEPIFNATKQLAKKTIKFNKRELEQFNRAQEKALNFLLTYSIIPNRNENLLCKAQERVRGIKTLDGLIERDHSDTREFMRVSIARNKLNATDFYTSPAWLKLKAEALQIWGKAPCCSCMQTLARRVKHVDHIKPRSKYPHLALKLSNLQVMCESCNMDKGNRNNLDLRNDEQKRRFGAV